MKNKEILVFEDSFIRRILKEENWYYYIEDIVAILSDYHTLTWNELKNNLDEQIIHKITEYSIKLTDNDTITQEYIHHGAVFQLLDSIPSSKKRRRFELWYHDITGAELVELACQKNKYINEANKQLKQILAEENFI